MDVRAPELPDPEPPNPEARERMDPDPLPHAEPTFPERAPYDVAPRADTLGLRHVELVLEDLDFPMTTRDIVDRAGHWRIPTTGNHFHILADYLDGLKLDARFRRPRDVARAIAKLHPEIAP